MAQIKIAQFIPEQNEKDFNQLLPAFLTIWNAVENHKHFSHNKHNIDMETVSHWLRNHVSQNISYYCAVDENDHIVGLSIIQEHPVNGLRSLGIGVRPEYKHQGIGSQLIAHLIGYIKQQDYSSAEVPVFADNIHALRLLLKHGFIPARMEHHKRYDGMDTVHMKYVST
jgi:ribosomal protein S18 acetylase RimI-like enzyme